MPRRCGTAFLSHLYIKTIILPRQARDKHRENSKKDVMHDKKVRHLGCFDDDREAAQAVDTAARRYGTVFFRPFILKTIFLPRQARDKHRKS
jgi:hypothetical protein